MRLGLIMVGLCLSISILSVSVVATPQSFYKEQYRMSVVVGEDLPWGRHAKMFTQLVAERTQGRIHIKVYPFASLLKGRQTSEFAMLNSGAADFAFASTINWSPQVMALNLFNLPFFFPDYAALDRVTSGKTGELIEQQLLKRNVMVLAWGENGFRELTNNLHAVNKPTDLNGLKIRVVGVPIFIETMQALGATPINMNWGEAKVAFQQNTVNGQENPITNTIIPKQLWQHHQYITLWHYTIDPLLLAVNQDVFNSFSAQDQLILQRTAKEVATLEKAAVRRGLLPPYSAHTLLEQRGMTVTKLNAEQLSLFKQAAQPIYDTWVPKIGYELVDIAKRDMAK